MKMTFVYAHNPLKYTWLSALYAKGNLPFLLINGLSHHLFERGVFILHATGDLG